MPTGSFEKALKHTLGIEGDFSNHPKDSGGKTRWGITEKKARAWGYVGEMKDLPLDLAKLIYRDDYWDLNKLGIIAVIDEPIALELFDTSVNCGVDVPIRHLQRLLNAFNREEKDYFDISVDGLVGRNTLHALSYYMEKRRADDGSAVMVEALNSLQGAYFIDISERWSKNETFTFGWFKHRVLKRASP